MTSCEAHLAVIGVLHFADHYIGHFLEFARDNVEVQLVMHLEYHLGTYALFLKAAIDGNHGYLYHIGSSALNWGVHCVALAEAAHHGVARVDVGQHAAATKEGGHIALLTCLSNTLLDVLFHFGEGLEVAVNKHLGLTAWNIKSLTQSKCRDAIEDAKVGGLSLSALVASDLVERFVVNLGCCDGMDVLILGKGVEHSGVVAQVGYESQFYLRIVGTEEHVAVGGDESSANFLSIVAAHWDVLQVGISRRQAAGSSHRLVVGGVDAASAWVHERGQCIDIGREQLAQAT